MKPELPYVVAPAGPADWGVYVAGNSTANKLYQSKNSATAYAQKLATRNDRPGVLVYNSRMEPEKVKANLGYFETRNKEKHVGSHVVAEPTYSVSYERGEWVIDKIPPSGIPEHETFGEPVEYDTKKAALEQAIDINDFEGGQGVLVYTRSGTPQKFVGAAPRGWAQVDKQRLGHPREL